MHFYNTYISGQLNMYFTNLDTTEIEGFPSSATFWGPRSCEVAIISTWNFPNHPFRKECETSMIMFHVNIFRGVVTPANHVSWAPHAESIQTEVPERDLSLHQKRRAFRLDMSVQRVTGGHRSSIWVVKKKHPKNQGTQWQRTPESLESWLFYPKVWFI